MRRMSQKTVVFNWLYRANMHFSECLDDLRFPNSSQIPKRTCGSPPTFTACSSNPPVQRESTWFAETDSQMWKRREERERGGDAIHILVKHDKTNSIQNIIWHMYGMYIQSLYIYIQYIHHIRIFEECQCLPTKWWRYQSCLSMVSFGLAVRSILWHWSSVAAHVSCQRKCNSLCWLGTSLNIAYGGHPGVSYA